MSVRPRAWKQQIDEKIVIVTMSVTHPTMRLNFDEVRAAEIDHFPEIFVGSRYEVIKQTRVRLYAFLGRSWNVHIVKRE